jgi:hypothetical protein
VLDGDGVVLARVVAARVPDANDPLPLEVEVDLVVLDVARGKFKKGDRFKLVRHYDGFGFSESEMHVGRAYVVMPKRQDDGTMGNTLWQPFELLDTFTPPVPNSKAQGTTWLSASTFWMHSGLMLPKILPLTFTDHVQLRTCNEGRLFSVKAWFTWEDLKRVPWTKLKDSDYYDPDELTNIPCAMDAKVPQILRCKTCGGEPMEAVAAIVCTGTESKVSLRLSRNDTSTWPARFRVAVTNPPKGVVFPSEVEPHADDKWVLVDFVDARLTYEEYLAVQFRRKHSFRLLITTPKDFPLIKEAGHVDVAKTVFDGRLYAPIDATHMFFDDVTCSVEKIAPNTAPAR